MRGLLSILLVSTISSVLAHSTRYPHINRNETCFNPSPVEIYSYHVHLLHWQHNQNHTAGALQVRQNFAEAFKSTLGSVCVDDFHNDYMCLFEPDKAPIGPFLTAQWAVFILPEHFNQVVPWFMQNRNGYDILVHPNSGCELEDHSWWALWGGKPWELDMSAFHHDSPFPWPEESLKTHQNQAMEESMLIRYFTQGQK